MTNQTPEERLAALENEKKHDQKFQDEVRTTLKRLPGRIARQTRRQIEECQRRMVNPCDRPDTTPAPQVSAKPIVTQSISSSLLETIDPKNIVKLLIVCIVVGGLVGGFVYQYRNPDHPITSLVQSTGK